jgi:hypothetical protein
MYKLIIPMLAFVAAIGCADNTPDHNAEALRVDAEKAEVDAKKAADEAEAKAKEAADATKAEWREFQRDNWDPNWDKFYDSTEVKWDSPDYRFERNKDEIVIERVNKGEGEAGSKVEDATLATAVNAQFATDKDVTARNINVEVVDNVVHLRGNVSTKTEAREAVRLAINTRGVNRVVSHLNVAP